MAKMSIAQLRERSVLHLAQRRKPEPDENDMALARRTMNSFYRLCGLDERLLYLENDERTYNKPYTINLAARRDRWFDRLNKTFQKEFNAQLVYFGYLPTICAKDSTQDLYLRHFYN